MYCKYALFPRLTTPKALKDSMVGHLDTCGEGTEILKTSSRVTG